MSFAYGPVYSFQLNAFLQLRHGILNLSTTTQNHFTVGPGTLWFEQDGDAANSSITNNHVVEFGGSSTAGTADINNTSGGITYFADTSSAPLGLIGGGGTTDYSYATAPAAVGSLTGFPTAHILLGSQTVSFGSLNSSSAFDGQIMDGGFHGGTGGALTKVGSGILQLTGNQSYTGKTTIQSGVLEVDGSLASPEVEIDTGTHLTGFGTVNNVAAQTGSFIDPGDIYNPHPPPKKVLSIGRLYYLLMLIYGTTNYSPGNIDFDFSYFPGYTQATGEILVSSLSSVSAIYLHLTNLGDTIFKNSFD